MKLFALIAVCSACILGLLVPSAQAGILMNATEAGGNVIITVNGSISVDPTSTWGSRGASSNFFAPAWTSIFADPSTGFAFYQQWDIDNAGPTSWGSGGSASSVNYIGDIFFFAGDGPGGLGLAMGQSTVDTTFTIAGTFTSLGLAEGTYSYVVIGDGGSTDSFVFTVGGGAVPEPSTYALLGIGFGAILLFVRRKRANGNI